MSDHLLNFPSSLENKILELYGALEDANMKLSLCEEFMLNSLRKEFVDAETQTNSIVTDMSTIHFANDDRIAVHSQCEDIEAKCKQKYLLTSEKCIQAELFVEDRQQQRTSNSLINNGTVIYMVKERTGFNKPNLNCPTPGSENSATVIRKTCLSEDKPGSLNRSVKNVPDSSSEIETDLIFLNNKLIQEQNHTLRLHRNLSVLVKQLHDVKQKLKESRRRHDLIATQYRKVKKQSKYTKKALLKLGNLGLSIEKSYQQMLLDMGHQVEKFVNLLGLSSPPCHSAVPSEAASPKAIATWVSNVCHLINQAISILQNSSFDASDQNKSNSSLEASLHLNRDYQNDFEKNTLNDKYQALINESSNMCVIHSSDSRTPYFADDSCSEIEALFENKLTCKTVEESNALRDIGNMEPIVQLENISLEFTKLLNFKRDEDETKEYLNEEALTTAKTDEFKSMDLQKIPLKTNHGRIPLQK